ncbi:MAG: light-harvesting antenna LH1, alpha subunit [Alphaproteobacteria bacterium]|nr:light-harvesting antenna LH1, alpha subunit [Alphaproteobacteria bacterium]
MWKVWLLFDPRRALVALAAFLFALAVMIHFVVLSTERFNWFEGNAVASVSPAVLDVSEMKRDIA